jgi:hypothetical protein
MAGYSRAKWLTNNACRETSRIIATAALIPPLLARPVSAGTQARAKRPAKAASALSPEETLRIRLDVNPHDTTQQWEKAIATISKTDTAVSHATLGTKLMKAGALSAALSHLRRTSSCAGSRGGARRDNSCNRPLVSSSTWKNGQEFRNAKSLHQTHSLGGHP